MGLLDDAINAAAEAEQAGAILSAWWETYFPESAITADQRKGDQPRGEVLRSIHEFDRDIQELVTEFVARYRLTAPTTGWILPLPLDLGHVYVARVDLDIPRLKQESQPGSSRTLTHLDRQRARDLLNMVKPMENRARDGRSATAVTLTYSRGWDSSTAVTIVYDDLDIFFPNQAAPWQSDIGILASAAAEKLTTG